MNKLKLLAVVIMASSPFMANANDTTDSMKRAMQVATHPAAVGAEISSLGYGGHIAWGANEYTELQAGWIGGDLAEISDEASTDIDLDDINFKLDAKFSNPYLAVQLRPLKNWLTVGAGVMHMGNSSINTEATLQEGESFTVQDIEYVAKADSTVDVELGFKNTIAPYASLGLRPNINNRFGLFVEAGAAYTGGYDVDFKTSGDYTYENQTVVLTEEQRISLENNGAKEFQDKIEEELGDYEGWFPIVKVGATVRF